MNIDLYLFNIIHGLSGKWQWLDYAGIFFAKYCEYFLWLALAIFLLVNIKKNWKMVVEAFLAAGISRFVITILIRLAWFRARPFVALGFMPLINKDPSEASFPSGHASFYVALSSIVYFYNKKLGTAFYIVTFLIVLSRVFVGVHWPADILAGALIGLATAWLTHKAVQKYFKKEEQLV